jgi:two-component system sensor histidine kinase/response regulator
MNLRTKALLLVIIPIGFLLLAFDIFSSRILFEGFLKIEDRWAVDNVQRAERAFQNIVSNLAVKSSDWAVWNDTYRFVEDQNQAYKDSNLGDVSFENLRINYMIYINDKGEIVFQKAVDFIIHQEMEVPEELTRHFSNNSPLIHFKSLDDVHSGLIMIENTPVIFVARPIITSNHEGPAHGTLIFAQHFDTLFLNQLSEQTKLSIQSLDWNNLKINSGPNTEVAKELLSRGIDIDIVDNDKISGYVLIKDVYRKPGFVLRVDLNRDIFKQAVLTNRYTLLSFTIICLVFIFLLIILLNVLFLRRIFRLVQELRSVGQKKDFQSRVHVEGTDEISVVARTVNDLLDQITASQKDIRLSEEKFRLLADSVPVLIWMSDASRNAVYLNKQWLNFTGRELEKELGYGWTEHIHPDDWKKFIDRYNDVYEQQKDFMVEYRLKRFDGRYRWLSCAAVARFDLNNKFIGFIGSCFDISDRKAYEEKLISITEKERILLDTQHKKVNELEQANRIIIERTKELEDIQKANLNILEDLRSAKQLAEEASRAKSQFLANMSHEIRTPLNAILGFTDLLSKTTLETKQKKYVDTVMSSGELLLSIISDILDISKIEAGKIKLEAIDFNVDYLVENIMNMIQGRLLEKPIKLTWHVHEGIVHNVTGDPTRLRQILINLLGNAVKFTEEGEIGLTVTKEADIPNDPDGIMLRFAVHDTGIGIPEEKRSVIFEPFIQGDLSITRQYGGTGLGLTITKQLVELKGGKIWVESSLGRGTKFFFTARYKKSLHPATKDIDLISVEQLKGKTVAIVDDMLTSQELLESFSQTVGMNVVFITNRAAQALSWLEQLKHEGKSLPDIIISDVIMPGMDGYTFASKIKENQEWSVIKMIAASSDARPGSAMMASKQGFDAFIPKPLNKEDLSRVIRTVLGDRRKGEDKRIVTKHLAQEASLKGVKMLVAEDNVANQQLIKAYADILGCDVEFANNGQEAIEMLKKKTTYDVCFMDMQMPMMSGTEATRYIRAHLTKDLPIVALTAAVLKEDQEECQKAGMNDFLAKPINLSKLKEKIALHAKRT